MYCMRLKLNSEFSIPELAQGRTRQRVEWRGFKKRGREIKVDTEAWRGKGEASARRM